MVSIKRRWQDELMSECWRLIDAGGGELRIQFSYRQPNKVVPIIKTYPDNQTICQEVEIEEE